MHLYYLKHLLTLRISREPAIRLPIGNTLVKPKGRGRMDRNNEYALSKKAIFMYPLQDDFQGDFKG